MPKYAYIKPEHGDPIKVQLLEKCTECNQIPWCLLIDMHEYGHLNKCSRS